MEEKNMKKSGLLLLMLLLSITLFSQRYAYVDTEYILENIPEYNDAQEVLDNLSVEWQKEIEAKFAEIAQLYKKFQSEASLLPQNIKVKREEEIINKEQEAKKLQNTKFGSEGELFKKRQELVQPIQEKVFEAVEKIAIEENYAFIFDKTGNYSILYADPKLDLSDAVLDKISNYMQIIPEDKRK